MITLDVATFDAEKYDRLAVTANAIYTVLNSGVVTEWSEELKQAIRDAMAYQVQFEVVDRPKGLIRVIGLVALEEGTDYAFDYDEGKPVVLSLLD